MFLSSDATELADLAMKAVGTRGRCRDYIDGVYQQLWLLGIEDPAVTAVWKSLQKLVANHSGALSATSVRK